jgi:hypothetical protein
MLFGITSDTCMYLDEHLEEHEILFVCLFLYPEVKDRMWTGKLLSLKYHDEMFIGMETAWAN